MSNILDKVSRRGYSRHSRNYSISLIEPIKLMGVSKILRLRKGKFTWLERCWYVPKYNNWPKSTPCVCGPKNYSVFGGKTYILGIGDLL